jgi:predicted TIM-barrel fold metal-dependent hydrolase
LTSIISCHPDETTMPQGVEALGEDKVIFASDYPHWDAVFPGAAQEVRARTGLSESANRKILGENAARLYGLM